QRWKRVRPVGDGGRAWADAGDDQRLTEGEGSVADDSTDIDKQLISYDKRFETYVPKPKSRIHAGTTAWQKDPDGPWGHSGITVATEENVVVSAAKDMVKQSGGNTNFLVGGALGHCTKGDVNLTSGADMRVSAAQRLLIM